MACEHTHALVHALTAFERVLAMRKGLLCVRRRGSVAMHKRSEREKKTHFFSFATGRASVEGNFNLQRKKSKTRIDRNFTHVCNFNPCDVSAPQVRWCNISFLGDFCAKKKSCSNIFDSPPRTNTEKQFIFFSLGMHPSSIKLPVEHHPDGGVAEAPRLAFLIRRTLGQTNERTTGRMYVTTEIYSQQTLWPKNLNLVIFSWRWGILKWVVS